jgi:acetyl-CoA/propionyl-CoA carboxylase biotin carboxyl carrier protein
MSFELKSPMPGKVQTVFVAPGDVVEIGTTTMNLEAMKIDIPIAAGHAGKVSAIHVGVAQMVEQGDLLLTIDE